MVCLAIDGQNLTKSAVTVVENLVSIGECGTNMICSCLDFETYLSFDQRRPSVSELVLTCSCRENLVGAEIVCENIKIAELYSKSSYLKSVHSEKIEATDDGNASEIYTSGIRNLFFNFICNQPMRYLKCKLLKQNDDHPINIFHIHLFLVPEERQRSYSQQTTIQQMSGRPVISPCLLDPSLMNNSFSGFPPNVNQSPAGNYFSASPSLAQMFDHNMGSSGDWEKSMKSMFSYVNQADTSAGAGNNIGSLSRPDLLHQRLHNGVHSPQKEPLKDPESYKKLSEELKLTEIRIVKHFEEKMAALEAKQDACTSKLDSLVLSMERLTELLGPKNSPTSEQVSSNSSQSSEKFDSVIITEPVGKRAVKTQKDTYCDRDCFCEELVANAMEEAKKVLTSGDSQ